MASALPFLRPIPLGSSASRSRYASAYVRFYQAAQQTYIPVAFFSAAPRIHRATGSRHSKRLYQKDRLSYGGRALSSHNVVKQELIGDKVVESGSSANASKKVNLTSSNEEGQSPPSTPPNDLWPRMPKAKNPIEIRQFRQTYGGLQRGATSEDVEVTVRGRVLTTRKLGANLTFIDLMQDGTALQCVLKKDKIKKQPPEVDLRTQIRRGDIISIVGHPHRTARNELSIIAEAPPLILSKCLNSLPSEIRNQETKMQNRYVDFLINRKGPDLLRLRSEVIKALRKYFELHDFVDVQTPILADIAGGASARPFKTSATEFADRELALRIAPELWLKKLIVGGFDKVYEIGPSFRNEGIDLTHNPEFWICEFYKAFANLDDLILMTEDMFLRLAGRARSIASTHLRSLTPSNVGFESPYRRIDFLPALEQAVGAQLPPLHDPSAKTLLLDVLNKANVKVSARLPLPQLLDKLSVRYLESQTDDPIWIVNHPECMSPLSKSFEHPENGQRVAARAELFVKKHEIVNCYEEENSPFEQRRKFEVQHGFRTSEHPAMIDEGYLEALQWGLPPTGGWGCGIERLVMLFGSVSRISDTLSFGTLRNVVSRSQENSLSPSVKSGHSIGDVAQKVDNSSATLGSDSSVVV